MLRHSMLSLPLALALTQLGLAQDTVNKEPAKPAAKPDVSNVFDRLFKASDTKAVAPQASATVKTPANRPTLAPPRQPQQRESVGHYGRQLQPGVSGRGRNAPPPVSSAATACVELDVLIGCVAFNEKGELRVKKEGAEPEINRAGTIGANLAAKLNEQRGKFPAGVSSGAAGANFLLQGLAGEEKLKSLEQLRLQLSSDEVEALLQSGDRMPRIVGTSLRSGHITNSVQMENMGTLVGASAQIEKTGKIVLSLEIERSGFGPEEEGTPVSVTDDKTIRTPRIDTMTLKTRVAVADGESIVLSSLVRLWGDKVTETFVVVTATILKP